MTLKEYILSGIKVKYLRAEGKQLNNISINYLAENTYLLLKRMSSDTGEGPSWITAHYSKEGEVQIIPKPVKEELAEINEAFKVFIRELDYLNNFLSVLLRSNVPQVTVETFIPEHVFRGYEENTRMSFNYVEETDKNITPEYIESKYTNEIYLLQKYLIYLLM